MCAHRIYYWPGCLERNAQEVVFIGSRKLAHSHDQGSVGPLPGWIRKNLEVSTCDVQQLTQIGMDKNRMRSSAHPYDLPGSKYT
jgi:hypothetical protein